MKHMVLGEMLYALLPTALCAEVPCQEGELNRGFLDPKGTGSLGGMGFLNPTSHDD